MNQNQKIDFNTRKGLKMAIYDYREALTEDIERVLTEGTYNNVFNYHIYNGEIIDKRQLYDELYDELDIDDSVTGNMSGSYTCNTIQAGEYVGPNWNILLDALDAWGYENPPHNIETADVMIRCYLLGECLWNVLQNMLNDKPEWLKKLLKDSETEEMN